MHNKKWWAGLLLMSLVVAACCYLVHVQRAQSGRVHVLPADAASSGATPSTIAARPSMVSPRTGPMPKLPRLAGVIADRYATAAFSTVAGESEDLWVSVVAPICSAQWLALIRKAENGAAIAASSTHVRTIHVFPSTAPSGKVAATVLVAEGTINGSIYVVMEHASNGYLVVATQ